MTGTMQDKPVGMPDGALSGVFLFFGIVLMLLGTIAIACDFLFTIGTVVVFGCVMVAAGVAELIHAFQARQGAKVLFNVLSGLVYIIAGALTIFNPILGALTLTLVMAGFFLVAGVVRIAYAFAHKDLPHWVMFLLGGVVNIVLSALIFTGWPATGLWIIGLFIGIEMLFHGISWIMLSTMVRGIAAKPAA